MVFRLCLLFLFSFQFEALIVAYVSIVFEVVATFFLFIFILHLLFLIVRLVTSLSDLSLTLWQQVDHHPAPIDSVPSLALCAWIFSHSYHLPNIIGWWIFWVTVASWHITGCRSYLVLGHQTPVPQSDEVIPKSRAKIVPKDWTWVCAIYVWQLQLTLV